MTNLTLSQRAETPQAAAGPRRGHRPAVAVTGPARQWFDALQVPHKELVSCDTCGHRSLFEQPETFHRLMLRTVQR